MRELLTQSRIKGHRSCRRKHKHRYVDGIRLHSESPALRFGSLVHAGLEAWNKTGRNVEAAITAVYAASTEYTQTTAYELQGVIASLAGYHERYSADTAEVLAVELEFQTPLYNISTSGRSTTFDLAGKVDAIYRIDGEVWIVEHKTTSSDISPGSDYWRRLQLDEQVSLYTLALRQLGYDVVGCIYDVIRKPRMPPLLATPENKRQYRKDGALYARQRETDETSAEYLQRYGAELAASPSDYYVRGEVVRLNDEIEEYQRDLWATAQEMIDARREERYPRNPSACHEWNRYCDYWDICTGVETIDSDNYKRTAIHEELNGQTGESHKTGDGRQQDLALWTGSDGQDHTRE
jgi:hypothetical protein